MHQIGGEWSGHITGTNNANIFVEIVQNLGLISGVARINDPIHGTAVYKITGNITGGDLQIEMHPDPNFFNKPKQQTVVINNQTLNITLPADAGHGIVSVNAKVISETHIEGSWSSTIGTGGKVFISRVENLTKIERTGKKEQAKASIFISYSHVDSEHLERLRIHLKPLEKNGVLEVWDDTKIKVGDNWEKEIQIALARSAIAVLIISADFLASDFIIDNELPPILSKAQLDGTKIVPVILKPCRFARDQNLSKFQALNPPDQPVQAMSETEQEDLWDRLSQIIEAEI